jgi:hypothetical protein
VIRLENAIATPIFYFLFFIFFYFFLFFYFFIKEYGVILKYIQLINWNHVCVNYSVMVFYINLVNLTSIVSVVLRKYSHIHYLCYIITVLYLDYTGTKINYLDCNGQWIQTSDIVQIFIPFMKYLIFLAQVITLSCVISKMHLIVLNINFSTE